MHCLLGLLVLISSNAQRPDKSITKILETDSRFTILRKLLKTTGLDTTLNGSEQFTLFAPTDAAFKKLPPGALQGILKEDRLCSPVATAHLLKGFYGTLSFMNGASAEGQPLRYHLTSYGGYLLTTEVTKDGLTIEGAKFLGEIFAKNGNVLVVDSVLPVVVLAPEIEGFSRNLPQELFRWKMAHYKKDPK